jgi:hypothetical protein
MRFTADENFNNDILRDVLRRYPELDVVRIEDTEVYEAEDPAVLEWVAQAGCVLLTHDTRTMPDFAYARVRGGKPLPGVFVVNDQAPMGEVIDDLLTILGASDARVGCSSGTVGHTIQPLCSIPRLMRKIASETLPKPCEKLMYKVVYQHHAGR